MNEQKVKDMSREKNREVLFPLLSKLFYRLDKYTQVLVVIVSVFVIVGVVLFFSIFLVKEKYPTNFVVVVVVFIIMIITIVFERA